MREDSRNPQINMSKLPVGSGIAGAIFTVGSMAIFLIGIPALRYFLPAAGIMGGVAALVIRSLRREMPSTAHILSAADKR